MATNELGDGYNIFWKQEYIDICTGQSGEERMSAKKLYILNIRYETQIKRLYFEGDDTDAANQLYSYLREDIPNMGEKSEDWSAFVANVIDHFQDSNFTQVKG